MATQGADRPARDIRLNRRSMLLRGGAVAAGAVGATVAASTPAAAAGVGFNPITPYRSFDTRDVGDSFPAGFEFDLDIYLDRNLDQRIPIESVAVTFNLTVFQTQGRGFLSVWPSGTPWPETSTLNWSFTNMDLANGGTVGLGESDLLGPGCVTILAGGTSNASTGFLIDVTGYYL